jgi:hypothetical protein
MKTPKQKLVEENKSPEKEQLELIEKKVDIQRKRLEIKKEKLNMSKIVLDKDLESRRAKLDMKELLATRNHESERILNDKIFSLSFSLTMITVDEERSILGSEPFLTPVLTGERREIVLDKLIEIITKM